MASATRCCVAVAILMLSACSGGATPSATTSTASTTVVAPANNALPLVGQIDDAVAALQVKLGAPQEFFEINATTQLVNLIVALNDGKVAQPWVYLDGQLTSAEGAPANGHTFAAGALDFDENAVLSQVQSKVPEASLDLFFVEGGEGGTVQYSVVATSKQGGQLVVVVGADGSVQSVTPN
ncbi:MAG TPA: hypothetical protein VIH06_00450 [Ilumatobacteraceae bacterium]